MSAMQSFRGLDNPGEVRGGAQIWMFFPPPSTLIFSSFFSITGVSVSSFQKELILTVRQYNNARISSTSTSFDARVFVESFYQTTWKSVMRGAVASSFVILSQFTGASI